MTTLNLSISPKLPHDPSHIQSMADYDLSLCLYRNWFEYDLSRNALPGLVKSWKFNKINGEYEFSIDSKAKWSDGSDLTSDHLVLNLKRILKSKSSYGTSLDTIIDGKNLRIKDKINFIVPIKNKKPSKAFFQRMGSAFLSITHPSDWDENGKVFKNTLFIGPYKIKEQNKQILSLEINQFDPLSEKKRVQKIQMNIGGKPTDLTEFLDGKGQDDIVQTYTLLPIETYHKILNSKLEFWTRSFDRVSYMAPLKYSKKSTPLRHYLRALGVAFQTKKQEISFPSNVKIAQSLQPKGYPLHKKITYQFDPKDTKKIPLEISILAIDNNQLSIQKPIIEMLTKTINPNIKLQWITKKNVADFIDALNEDSLYDLKLLSFGVADPEAATWLSLVLNKDRPFIEINKTDLLNFNKILSKHKGLDKEVSDLKEMILTLGERGSYLPLFHFSTMSIGKKGISFEKISELDETVNYSKLVFK